ncbi:biotin--[acetyl-CoA-carboxylase] ligase [Skermania sp. ID1734]|uniref:biotin--[acetyl-CoA-carboxylase] ligase n=1 Tax=Skermania sp. ID1734 TaxID=2597516 RepID=UPI00117F789C|nr:biotin--[acetyl-CoA-carboxylase] ligase [Skermania sp. ID1734]TSD97375.1 biotin--[acetyl-CoA-carboxylase] ligase [Skermania sp. ID1734]
MFSDLNRPPLRAADLRRGLDFYTQLDVVSRTGSTNADLLGRAADPAADRSVLIAEFQERGRGRHSRSWEAPAQSQIAMSILLHMVGIGPEELGWLPLLTGVAVVDAVREVAKVDAELKWPNDIIVGDKKLAGILAEVGKPGPDPVVVVGLGLNVSLREEELPVPHATSLLLLDAEVTDRATLVRAILRSFASRISRWQDAGWAVDELAADYRQRCASLGSSVRADLPGGEFLVGTAVDIDEQGRLLIDVAGGNVPVSAGDVTHLRTVS